LTMGRNMGIAIITIERLSMKQPKNRSMTCYVDCQIILQEALFFSILLLMVTFMAPG